MLAKKVAAYVACVCLSDNLRVSQEHGEHWAKLQVCSALVAVWANCLLVLGHDGLLTCSRRHHVCRTELAHADSKHPGLYDFIAACQFGKASYDPGG